MSFTVVTSRSVILAIHPFCLLVSRFVSHKNKVNGKKNRKHKCKKLWFPSPAFGTEKQCFISVVEVSPEGGFPCLRRVLHRQKLAVNKVSRSRAELANFSAGLQIPSLQSVPISCR